jgi:hypothetical protein
MSAVNSRVVLIHVWSREEEESIQAFPRFLALQTQYPEYNHMAVHIDLSDSNPPTTPETFQKSNIIDSSYNGQSYVSLVDIKKDFLEYWKSCEFPVLPCTMIVIDSVLYYVGPSHHECSISFFGISIQSVLTQLPAPISSTSSQLQNSLTPTNAIKNE